MMIDRLLEIRPLMTSHLLTTPLIFMLNQQAGNLSMASSCDSLAEVNLTEGNLLHMNHLLACFVVCRCSFLLSWWRSPENTHLSLCTCVLLSPVPRPSPVFDCLQYAKAESELLEKVVMWTVCDVMTYRQTGSGRQRFSRVL